MKILTLNLWNINEPLIKRMKILKKFLPVRLDFITIPQN